MKTQAIVEIENDADPIRRGLPRTFQVQPATRRRLSSPVAAAARAVPLAGCHSDGRSRSHQTTLPSEPSASEPQRHCAQGAAVRIRVSFAMSKKFPIHPPHPERLCWGCDKYCPAESMACGNGSDRPSIRSKPLATTGSTGCRPRLYPPRQRTMRHEPPCPHRVHRYAPLRPQHPWSCPDHWRTRCAGRMACCPPSHA